MKKILISATILMSALGLRAQDADSLGLPGDNLDLRAVLGLFKESKDLESFEKSLNDENKKINNLDLNGDSKIDYIRVVDQKNDKVHAIALQVPVSATESQDVAVIEIEKTGDSTAQLQIRGDEELYGKDYYVEPQDDKDVEDNSSKANGRGPSPYDPYERHYVTFVYVNVWDWPCVYYMYEPVYVVWVSPWYWGYYPGYWHPWHPYAWGYYHPWYPSYYHHCYVVHEHRMHDAYSYYGPHRMASPTVHNRYEPDHRRREARVNGNGQGGRDGNRTAPVNGNTMDRGNRATHGNDVDRGNGATRGTDVDRGNQPRQSRDVNRNNDQHVTPSTDQHQRGGDRTTPRQDRGNRQVSPGGGNQPRSVSPGNQPRQPRSVSPGGGGRQPRSVSPGGSHSRGGGGGGGGRRGR